MTSQEISDWAYVVETLKEQRNDALNQLVDMKCALKKTEQYSQSLASKLEECLAHMSEATKESNDAE